MIRLIAAVDENLGIANDSGIPWLGRIPTDTHYYREKISDGSPILMGMGVYNELTKPYRGGINYVASHEEEIELREGFVPINDVAKFLAEHENVWVVGGAMLFSSTLHNADELYLTRLSGDFGCTKFFPQFEDSFVLLSSEVPVTEDGITFHFEVWKKKY